MKQCSTCRNSYPDDYQTCPRDQTPLSAATGEIVVGTVLRGKYEVLGELGAGGMATVYKVRHKAFQELAAVKVVHPHFMHDPDFVKRFRNEAIVARQLKHPNAVRIDDFDYADDGRPFIVMEYVEGHSLYDIRKQYGGAWPVERCLNIVTQAASALAAAHALGIVHRDIKPSNILLLRGPDGEGHVKLLDFGIAKVGDKSFAGMTSVMTSQDLIIGTPEYMSPEQARGKQDGEIDGRADLYSLGLVLYEMLTGSHPFQADTPMGMLMQQLHTPPPPLTEFQPTLSPAISALVLKALEKDARDRFQSAGAMLDAMQDPEGWYAEELEPGVAVPEAPVPAVPAAPEPTKKLKPLTVLAAAPDPEDAAAVLRQRKPPTVLASAPPTAVPTAAPPLTPAPLRPKDPTVFAAHRAATLPGLSPPPMPPSIPPLEALASEAALPVPAPRAKRGKSTMIAALITLVVVLACLAVVFLRKPAGPAAVLPQPVPQPASQPIAPAADVAPPPVETSPLPKSPAVDPEKQAKIAKLLVSGNRALGKGDNDIAAEFFAEALGLDPDNAAASAGLQKAKAAKP
jgi:serine/threonine protein kinase